MTVMSDDEWRGFVTEGSRLGNAAICRSNGLPHVTPICFIIEGDQLIFTTHPGSVKGRSIAHGSRIAVCVSDEAHPYRFAMLEGEAALSDDPDEILRVGMAIGRRYVPWQDPEEFSRSLAWARRSRVGRACNRCPLQAPCADDSVGRYVTSAAWARWDHYRMTWSP